MSYRYPGSRGSNKYLFAFILFAIIGTVGIKIFGEVLFFIIVIIGFAGYQYIKYQSLPVCPHCKCKAKQIFLHLCIDGAPDLRYKVNPLICSICRNVV